MLGFMGISEVINMARPKGSKNKSSQPKATETRKGGSIQKTNTWLNVHNKAVYLNIPEADIKLVNTEYGKKAVFVTSLDSIKRLASGEIQGVNLGTFED